jgi:hypothetical protein
MSRWETTSTFAAEVAPAAIWSTAYAHAEAWPRWNAELKRARLDFRSGLRLRFRVVEFEDGRLFTDEARLPGARMGHRHLLEPLDEGTRLTNTIYIEGRLAPLWKRVLGPAAVRSLPDAQRAIVAQIRNN